MVENPSSYTFLDQNSPSAVLGFIDYRFALSLNLEECPNYRRPAQNSGVSKMEYIVKAIVILFDFVVGQTIANIDSSTLQPHIGFLARRSLRNVDLDVSRK